MKYCVCVCDLTCFAKRCVKIFSSKRLVVDSVNQYQLDIRLTSFSTVTVEKLSHKILTAMALCTCYVGRMLFGSQICLHHSAFRVRTMCIVLARCTSTPLCSAEILRHVLCLSPCIRFNVCKHQGCVIQFEICSVPLFFSSRATACSLLVRRYRKR